MPVLCSFALAVLLAAAPAASPTPSTPVAGTTPAATDTPTVTAPAPATFAAPVSAPATATGRDFDVPTLADAPTLDGRLDDPVWKKAAVLGAMTDFRPVEDVPLRENTTIYVYRDATHLYVGFDAEDDEPSKVRASLADRDGAMADDWVAIFVDPYATGRHAVLFVSNPLGVQTDCLESENSNDDCSYDTVFATAGRLDGHGYQVEMAIPFSSLRLDPDADTWGFTPMRFVSRTAEQAVWPAWHNADGNLLQQFARMHGMKGLHAGAAVQVIPEITARTGPGAGDGAALSRADAPSGLSRGATEGDVGLTAKLTRGDTAVDATVNPDFSQVESDPARVTINQRFALSYDEKRPFFFEGREQFVLPWTVIYTRSIVDPLYGVKVTGREGPTSYALLHALDEHPAGSTIDPTWTPDGYRKDPALTTLMRAATEMNDRITVGMVATDKHVGPASNRLVGPDVNFHLTRQWSVVSQALWSGTDNPDSTHEDGTAFKARVIGTGRQWNWFSWYEQTDSGFRAEAGFIPRVGYRETGVDTNWKFETASRAGLRFVRPDLHLRALDSTINDDLNRDVQPGLGFNFGHSAIFTSFAWSQERFEHELFTSRSAGVEMSSSRIKWLDLDVSLVAGDQIAYFSATPYMGSVANATVTASVKPTERLTADLSWYREVFSKSHSLAPKQFNDQGVYDATVARLNLQFHLTRAWSARVIPQWSSPDHTLTVSSLVSWRPGPGKIVYAGYTDAAADARGVDTSRARLLFVKFSWLFRG